MAISYTYPRVDVNTTALTRRILTETVEDTLVMLSIFNANAGPINTINRIHTLSQFESIYGTITNETFGLNGMNIKHWLSNGGTVYAMRHIPTSAAAEAYYDSGTGGDISIAPGVNSHIEIPGNETKKINIFKSYQKYARCNEVASVLNKPYSMLVEKFIGKNEIHVVLGALHLRYTSPQGISGEKIFPVYFPITSSGAINFNGALPFQLCSYTGGIQGNGNVEPYVYKISSPVIDSEIEGTTVSYSNREYTLTSVAETQPQLSTYFTSYFGGEGGASAKLNENYLSLPQPQITIGTGIEGGTLTLSLSDVAFYLYPDKIYLYPDKIYYNNIAYEGDFNKDSYWSIDLGGKINSVYDKTLQTDDVFQSIFKLAILNANSVESFTNKTSILTDYVSEDGYTISLDAIAFVNSSDDINNVKMSLNNPADLFNDSENEYYLYSEWNSLSDVMNRNLPIKSMFGTGFYAADVDGGGTYDRPIKIQGYYTTITIKHPTKIVSKTMGSGYNNLNLKILTTGNQINYRLAMGQDLVEIGNMNNISNLESPDNTISDYFYIEDGFLKESLFEQHLIDTVNNPRLSDSLVGLKLTTRYQTRTSDPNPPEIISVIDIQKSDLMSIVTDLILNESKLSVTNGDFKFSGGTDQIIVDNNGNTDSSPQSLTVYSALTTEYTRKILKNTLEFPIDIFFDAGYSLKTKHAIYNSFCTDKSSQTFIRNDINVILDCFFVDDIYSKPTKAIYALSSDYASGAELLSSGFPKTNNTKNLSIYEQYYTVLDNNKLITVSPTYYLSENISYNDISLGYGTHSPIAGMKRGIIEGYKSINKQYLPDETQELFDNDVNYATVYRNGTAFMTQRTYEDDTQNTALQFFNNSFTTNRIVKELERLARAFLFEYNDAVSMSNLRKTLNQYIGRYVADRVLTYAVLDVQRDEYNPEQINIALNIKFNNTVEVIEVNLVIE